MRTFPAMPFGTALTEANEQHRSHSLRSIPRDDQRSHPRAELTLPVRLRWLGPFGLETETTQSRNVSRSGLLVTSSQPRHAGSLAWVTFPYDAGSALAEPETPARVARCDTRRDGNHVIGIAFEPRKPASGDQYHRIPRGTASLPGSHARKYFEIGDRRRRERIALALFVRVSRNSRTGNLALPRHEDAPWPEETMTMNVSPGGILFCSLRIYEAGDRLTFAFPRGAVFPDGERTGRVVHQAPLDSESPLLCVGVEFLFSVTHKT